MEPILKGHFNTFKKSFEIDIVANSDQKIQIKEASAFEKFVNYTIFSLDDPNIFTADAELLDFVSVGGGNDTGIDGIGIRVNNRLVKNIDEIIEIIKTSRRINIEYIFIQSKMRPKFDKEELQIFGAGVKVFFSEAYLPENAQIKEFRNIKDFLSSDEQVIKKLDKNPSVHLYYVGIGTEPTDENFAGHLQLITKEIEAVNYFETTEIKVIGGKQIIKFCRELENQFEVQMNIVDIFPLIVDSSTEVKKAYAFTCNALEFLKVLQKEDGSLRRSLFNDNVRDYLGNQGAVNSEIEETIVESPEMFLLCNNGVTIVCTDFEQVQNKLVKIENPQIVNGCQTSNSLFSLKNHPNIGKTQILVKLVSTENLSISNKIVRGSNKQNQVLEEAFEATLPFHQETLEPFFLSFDRSEKKIYYERRSKQYNEDPLINKTQIVNLRILTQAFVSIFLENPHESHRHHSILLKRYTEGKKKGKEERKIFKEDHNPYLYYICALIWYMFEKQFREGNIEQKYLAYKYHLYLVFRMSVGEFPPQLNQSKKMDGYCDKLLQILQEDQFMLNVEKVLSIFDETQDLWKKSIHGIKDNKGFTELLIKQSRKCFIQNPDLDLVVENNEELTYQGTILNIIVKDDFWFGFIKPGGQYENIYFDVYGYRGNLQDLSRGTKVRFEVGVNKKGDCAININIIN